MQEAVTKRYYPALSELITVDDLPEFLDFAGEGLDTLLSKIYYKNFQFSKSYRGDAAFYSLDVITKNIGIDLPFGLRFVLNPDEEGDSAISSFPISLEYQWEVFAFLKSFNLQNFSDAPDAMFKMGLQVFRVTDGDVIAQALNYFIDQDDPNTSKFETLIDDINQLYSANLDLPVGVEITVELVAKLIRENPNIPASIPELILELYILNADVSVTKRNLQDFFAVMAPGGIESYVQKLLKPQIKTSLKLTAAIEFPNNVLKPVTATGEPIPNKKTIFKFAEANFFLDTEGGIGSDVELAGSLIPEHNQIANTGLTIGFTGVKLDLSRKTNIPEADAAGYPVDFVGVYIKHATVGFNRFGVEDPNHVSAAITADNLFIGTGGVTGTISLESDGSLYRKFGDFGVELTSFSVTFRQNAIVNADIRGKLKLTRFKKDGADAVIDIQVHINDNGDFIITALPQPGVLKITLPEVLELEIMALSLGNVQRGFFIEIAGKLNFIADLPVLGDVLPKGIHIKRLRIWDDGEIEFEGGGLVLPQSFRLNVGPVKLEVSNMGISPYSGMHNGIERSYRAFGFNGMINTGRAGVTASGNGIKFYFTVDHGEGKPFHCFVGIDGIAIDITIPGSATKDKAAFTLQGFLSVKNPDPQISGSHSGSEYSGAVSFAMPRLKMGGSAGMRLKPDVPSFIVDIGMEMSTPIPLGATGLGIYGFRGLIGQHYMPSKAAAGVPDGTWWDYYKAPSSRTGREGIEIDKFANEPGYSVGAGVSIATSFDSGKVFSSKLFLLLGLPNVFLIQGQAGILRSRIGLADDVDPPFSAFIAIDDSSFRANIGVNYRLPEGGNFDGWIFSLSGALDMAFFFNNASGWYLNVGKDQPESARVRAKILTIFQGYAYLMISSRGFKAGAGAKFDYQKKFGPLSVGLGASLELGGAISFKPVQVGGFIRAGGYAYLKVWKARLGLSVQLWLAVEAPHPFNISGGIDVSIRLIFKFKFRIEFTWRINNNYGPLLAPIRVLDVPNPQLGYIPATTTNVQSDEHFAINFVTQSIQGNTIPSPGSGQWSVNFHDAEQSKQVTVPLDSFVDIELMKPVKSSLSSIGGANNQMPDGYRELLPPQKGMGKQVVHEFELTGVNIYAWRESDSTWVPYNVYEAVTAIVEENTGPDAIDLSELKMGYWQFSEPNKFNKIRLLSQNVFSYLNQSKLVSSDIDGLNFKRKDLFVFDTVINEAIVDWLAEPSAHEYPINTEFFIKGVYVSFEERPAFTEIDPLNGKQSLFADSGGKVAIRLPNPVSYLKLDFGSNENNIRVDFIQNVYGVGEFGTVLTTEKYLTPAFVNPSQQGAAVTYDQLDVPIDKLVLTFRKQNDIDFEGDLVVGDHFELPDDYIDAGLMEMPHDLEEDKALAFVRLFNQAFTGAEILDLTYQSSSGKVGEWKMVNTADGVGSNEGIVSGSPDRTSGYYMPSVSAPGNLYDVYAFSGNADALLIPFAPSLKVENGDFSFDATVLFSPFSKGISTLLSKVKTDPVTGHKKGFALHLYQDTPGSAGSNYTDGTVPSFSLWLTCYQGNNSFGKKVTERYTIDYETSKLAAKQYKHIFVSVNRALDVIDIYVDRQLKASIPIPAELEPYAIASSRTAITQMSYLNVEKHRRKAESGLTRQGMIDELEILSNTLNKTIQPVWRPNTIFAVVVKTKDWVRMNGDGQSTVPVYANIYGFKTAGPIGHFHPYNSVYQALAEQDRSPEFKLASLKNYIDYERSFPDAQSRYDLSKPVFYQDPQIALFFTKPYINAMYENWASYQGLPAVNSSLQLQVLDPFGTAVTPQLAWEQSEQTIDTNNYQSLPPDQQILFLMNAAAGSDNEHPVTIKKKTKRGSYHLPDLLPNSMYTALYTAIYQPQGEVQKTSEVHKYNFTTSRFATFQDQAGSFVLDATVGQEKYALYPIKVGFTEPDIDTKIKVLIDDNPENDPEAVLNYAVKFDRLVYGGLKLTNLNPVQHSVIELVLNVNPVNVNDKKILGILIRNPEAFNDPKLPKELLADTVQLTAAGGPFIYIHARDTSAVFITNAGMNVPVGSAQVGFTYKFFDGQGYQDQHYMSPAIQLTLDLEPNL